jgi:hypothetical protein
MRRMATVATILCCGMTLNVCAAYGSTIPKVYLAAQVSVQKVNSDEGAAFHAETHNQPNKIASDYVRELHDCRTLGQHTNGPNKQMNRLLERFSTDCATDAIANKAFWQNPNVGDPTKANQRVISDLNAINALWKRLGY